MQFDFKAHGLIEPAIQKPLPAHQVGGPQTIADILDPIVASDPQRTALVGVSGRYTYEELDRQVNQMAQALIELGLEPYDRVAACLPNDVHIVIALLACARAGGIWVGINRPLAGPEKAYLLNDSAAKIYLADSAMIEEISDANEHLDKCPILVCVEPQTRCKPDTADHEWHDWLSRVEHCDRPSRAIESHAPAAIAYTSGTTGFPKGAVHSHHNIMLPGAMAVYRQSYGADCPQGVMLPLTILNLMVLGPMVAFQDGSTCVCMDSLKPEPVAAWIKAEKVGHFASVPTVVYDLLTCEAVSPDDLVTLQHPDIGGAGVGDELQRLYKARFGRGIIVAYGMTEAPTIVTRSDPDKDPLPELCGQAVEQLEVLICDPEGKTLATDTIGEICVRARETGPFAGIYTAMLGYWCKADASAAALAGAMFHTGDMGRLDEGGNLFVRGRRNELIIRGGANVYPAEVERIMMQHEVIACAAVLGIDDERLGQRVVAAIEIVPARQGENPEHLVELVSRYCLDNLARYKAPDTILIVENLPRNAMNKVIKPRLVDLFVS